MQNPITTFWRNPRQLSWRPIVFWLHLWCGVTIGTLVSLVCITGTVIVFKPEIERAMIRQIAHVEPGATRVPVQQQYEAVMKKFPTAKVGYADLYPDANLATGFDLGEERSRIQVYVNPYTGEVVGADRFQHKWTQWIYDLHVNLLSGKTGELVNGYGALSLVLLCITGIVVWWPGRKLWRSGFTYESRAKWKRKNYDIHKLIGIASAMLLAVIAITGAYFPFEKQFLKSISAVTRTPALLGPPKTAVLKGTAPLNADDVLATANRAMPEGDVTMLNWPTKAGTTFSVRKRLPGDFRRMGDNLVYINQYTGQVARTTYHRDLSRTIRWTRDIGPIHYGTFWGMTSRIVWLLLGIGPIVLYTTGWLMWWNRVLSKKFRGKQSRSGQPTPKVEPIAVLTT